MKSDRLGNLATHQGIYKVRRWKYHQRPHATLLTNEEYGYKSSRRWKQDQQRDTCPHLISPNQQRINKICNLHEVSEVQLSC